MYKNDAEVDRPKRFMPTTTGPTGPVIRGG